MKTFRTLTSFLFVASICLTTNLFAQNYTNGGTQIVRNSSPVTYKLPNPDHANATFTWNVTGGTIVGQGTSYTQVGTVADSVSIQVTWNSANTTSANTGTLNVYKTIGSCSGSTSVFSLTVESWVDPSITASTTNSSVCSGSAPTFDLSFQGKSNYGYTWQVVNAVGTVVQVPTTVSNITTSATTVTPGVITNTTGTAASYQLQITYMQDGFTDKTFNSIVSVNFTVNPVPTINSINSSINLTPRP